MPDQQSEVPDHQSKHRRPTFDRFATLAARWMGHGLTFGVAVLLTLAWALSGPIFHFSNAWQLIINTTTTVLTFLMVFLIQNTLNRNSAAIHVKLDELVHVTEQERDQLIGVEHLGDKELERTPEGRGGWRPLRGLERPIVQIGLAPNRTFRSDPSGGCLAGSPAELRQPPLEQAPLGVVVDQRQRVRHYLIPALMSRHALFLPQPAPVGYMRSTRHCRLHVYRPSHPVLPRLRRHMTICHSRLEPYSTLVLDRGRTSAGVCSARVEEGQSSWIEIAAEP